MTAPTPGPVLTAERRAELRAEHAEVMRDAEKRCRASGMYEHANALRMLADCIIEGRGGDTVFDSGVFDKHGPVDVDGEVPYLVEESPRLKPCACGAAVYFVPRNLSTGAGCMLARRGGRYVCKPCFEAQGRRRQMSTPDLALCPDCGVVDISSRPRDDWERFADSGCWAKYGALGKRGCAERTIARMRPVVEAAMAWGKVDADDQVGDLAAQIGIVSALEASGYIQPLPADEVQS